MRSISVGPVNDLSFIQSENIKSIKSIKSDNPKRPFCLNIEFHNGKTKLVYFLYEDDANRNLKKVKTEMEKVFKNNNFQKILPEIPKTRTRKNKKAEITDAKVKAKSKKDVKAKAEPKAKTKAKTKAEVKPKVKAKPKATVKPKVKTKPKTTVKAKTKAKPKAIAKPKSKAKKSK